MDSSSSELELFFKPYIRTLQWLCVSNFSVFRPEFYKNRRQVYFYSIYFALFIASHVYLLIALDGIFVVKKSPLRSFGPLILIVNALSVIGNFINHTTLHVEALVQGKNERKIYQIFLEINEIFNIKLHQPIEYSLLRKKYARSMVPFFIFIAIIMFFVTYHSISTEHKIIFIAFRIYVMIVICGRELYIALLLSVLGDFLNHLRMSLSNEQTDFRNRIRFYRQIYSKFGQITDLISQCFGLTLLTFLIQFTFDLINLSYWLFINITILNRVGLSISSRQILFLAKNNLN